MRAYLERILSIKNLLPFLLKVRKQDKSEVESFVDYTIKKYGKTYKLLEEYDRGTKKATEEVARSRFVQNIIRDLQREAIL